MPRERNGPDQWESNISIIILPLTSPKCCFNSPTVQPCSALIGSAGATLSADRSITDILRSIPRPSNTCTCNHR